MKISIQCGQCGKQYQVKPELAGKKVKCQACGTPIPVPAGGEAKAETAPKKASAPAAKGAAKPSATAAKAPASTKAAASAPANANVNVNVQPAAPQHSILDEHMASAARLPGPGEMYCPKCKAIISGASVICVTCGFSLQSGRATRVASEANRPKRKPGQMPPLGIVIGILAILYGLPSAVVHGFQLVQCVLIMYHRGLPKGDDPIAAIGMFGFPVALLLFLAGMLLFMSGIGILRKVKGATLNAVLASKIFVGFGVFAIVVMGGVYAMNVSKPKKEEPVEKKVPTVQEMVTLERVMTTVIACGLGMIVPTLIWAWGATQGRRWDWELPEPVHKVKLKPTAKVGGPQPEAEKK
jgi:ribosomal protein S27E